ncbi:hypothetical protein [Plantactinospora sp. B24E8]|uniref:hypothetical protein n=1 Tax=Plantactinospora sp. B24E8 TaxID=3153567 RepID=UPI00325ED48A
MDSLDPPAAGNAVTDLGWWRTWRAALRTATAAAILDFETRYGYPPGDNGVSEPETAGVALVAAAGLAIPADLRKLYAVVGAVDLPDVGNGFFLHSVAQLAGGDLRQVRGRHDADVVVFASDGGGTRYALATPVGAPVYRLPAGQVVGGVYTSDDPCFGMAAPDLATFLAGLLRAVEEFARSGATPHL